MIWLEKLGWVLNILLIDGPKECTFLRLIGIAEMEI